MTAHPESVVAKLRALMQRADEAGFDPPHYAAQVECEEAVRDTVPALLAALEAVWASLDDFESGYGAARREIRAILGPLFESPEAPSHD